MPYCHLLGVILRRKDGKKTPNLASSFCSDLKITLNEHLLISIGMPQTPNTESWPTNKTVSSFATMNKLNLSWALPQPEKMGGQFITSSGIFSRLFQRFCVRNRVENPMQGCSSVRGLALKYSEVPTFFSSPIFPKSEIASMRFSTSFEADTPTIEAVEGK